MSGRKELPPTYLRCECGYKEDGVCGLFFGYVCPECGGVGTADIIVRRKRTR